MAGILRPRLSALRKNYFSDCKVIEISNLESIKNYYNSKTSACWVSHEVLEGEWVQLFQLSPRHCGAKPLVGVCRKENLRKALGQPIN